MLHISSLYIYSYKHALDGLIRAAKEEGPTKLFNGAIWASSRAVAVTIGQLCFYDLIKAQLLKTQYFQDNLTTHFTSSLCAVSMPTLRKKVYIIYRFFFSFKKSLSLTRLGF